MILDYIGVKDINGPLIVLDNVQDAFFEEVVGIRLDDGSVRQGRIVQMEGNRAVIQVFEGTRGLSLTNTRTRLTGHPMEMPLSPELLGRIFDGSGRPIDGLGDIFPVKRANVNGTPINPFSRIYPKDYINTGISTIDTLMTLIRGQKLPIFSGSGMKHNELAVQIARQAKISDEKSGFAIVFAAMGVKNDVADYFRRSFSESGILNRVVMFLNLANDPIVERILTPRCALTVAEYLAFELNMHILVIMTDMTAYAEALREFSSSKGEIPGRKGYPGYLYSDLASLYERAGMVKGKTGSVTQLPILTMPNDDVTHPVPDLTGYITEGQIVLDRSLDGQGVYPPVAVLPSLSRLMKDGIGKGYTREDHSALSNQLFASYAKVMDVRSLASVIGEEELSPEDKKYLEFGKLFEAQFVNQGPLENRTIDQSLNLGWELLATLPRETLDRVDDQTLDQYYEPAKKRLSSHKDSQKNDSQMMWEPLSKINGALNEEDNTDEDTDGGGTHE
ncbi:MAG: V-type ATP synthase subunit B [Oscillospiraceae bacterium]|jgi:V/A-type H+-transporting ATPase subunit B|nr:V-type ATP synthase subunit B [Oscillospiraceae bacterium]